MKNATVPEIVASFLQPGVVLQCAVGAFDADQLGVHVRMRSQGSSGPGYWVSTDRDGCRWSNDRGSGLVGWAELWRYATAGATTARVEALKDAYRAYVRHVVDKEPGDYGALSAGLDAAAAAIVHAAPEPDEQLDLFGGVS